MTNDHRQRQGITVSGTGTAAAAVDEVTITLGVEILRPDAGEAFRAAAGTVTSLLSVLSDNGVDARSVRTADLSLGPRTNYRDGGHEVLLGYAASQRMIVHLEALGNVERILSEVAARGGVGVRIDGVALTAGNPEQAYRDARAAAFAAAADKAQQYATLAGRTLGAVQQVSEDVMNHGIPMAVGLSYSRAKADTAMSVSTGDTEVSATVQVRWGFADAAGEPRPV